MEKKKVSKKKRIFKVFLTVILSVCLFFLVINVVPPKKVVKTNPFIVGDGLPLLAAHRGGGDNAPENTMAAYIKAVNENKADIIETDMCLTKDGYLVFIHDRTIDDTSDVDMIEFGVEDDGNDNHYVKDYTLAELKQFNFGYKYEENGNRIYKDIVSEYALDDTKRGEVLQESKLQIVELSELFENFYVSNPNLLFIIEIKNSGEDGLKAVKVFDEVMKKYPEYADQIVIGTFNPEVEEELKRVTPNTYRGASTSSAAKFVATQMLGVNLFDNSDFSCLQIPMSFDFELKDDLELTLTLDKKNYINRAHRRNIAVQYWTINDESDMRRLIDLGCDAIMTDNPKLLREVLDSYSK